LRSIHIVGNFEHWKAHKQEKDAILNKTSWQMENYFWHFLLIVAAAVLMAIVGPSYSLLYIPFWIYCVGFIIVPFLYVIFGIMVDKNYDVVEDEVIEYIFKNNMTKNMNKYSR